METIKISETKVKTVTVETSVEVPVLDFSLPSVIEVLEGGNGSVFYNGVLLKGVKLSQYETKNPHPYGRTVVNVWLALFCGGGELAFKDVGCLKITPGNFPTVKVPQPTVTQSET